MFLNKRELVGSDVESIDIGCKASVGLLAAVRSDQGVDLEAVDVVKLLESKLDLSWWGVRFCLEVVLRSFTHPCWP